MSSPAEESIVGAEKIVPLVEPSSLKESDSAKMTAEKLLEEQPASTTANGKPVSLCTDPTENQESFNNSDSTGLKRKMEALESTESGNVIATLDTSDNPETKKRCIELEARIKNIRIEVTSPMGEKLKIGGIECANVNLVNEDLLNVAKREILGLKATISKLSQELITLKRMLATQHEETKVLKVQCEAYKKGIELERIARQKTAAQIASDLQSLLKRNQMLFDEKVDVISAAGTDTAAPTHSISVPSAAPSTSTWMEIVDDDRANAVARLFRIQKVAKKPEPVYTLISDHRTPTGRREFVMEVECNGEKARGTGPNKRASKRMASENLLAITGYAEDQPSIGNGNKKTLRKKAKRRATLENANSVEQQAGDESWGTDELLLKNQDSADLEASNDSDPVQT